ncbi:MAG: glutamyl-tRNA reductase, partial [Actinobacteria bacterium]|nr:glutamyl-tRNA reductase [Actinomycetota bacterium]
CNRFELYLDADGDDAVAHALAVAAEAAGRPVEAVRGLLDVAHDGDAAHHLFRVAAGLSSAVVGEQEVRGQVRRAVELARTQDTLSPALNRLVDAALEASRDVARRTRLGDAGRSSVAVALDMVERLGVRWGQARAVIAGTGSYAGTSLAQLRERGCGAVSVHSASGRADGFAERHVVEALPAGGMGRALAGADVVVACRGTGMHAITAEMLAPVMEQRDGRPLVIVDLALHRDVEDAVAGLAGVELITLEDVGRAVPAAAVEDMARGEEIVLEHLAAYHAENRQRTLDAEVVTLRRWAEEALERELARLPAEGAVPVEHAARSLRRLVGVLVHVPTERAHAAGRAGKEDEYREALKAVLGIEAP